MSEVKRDTHISSLESVRGLAAFYVILHHTSSNLLGYQNKIWGQPFRFGEEAVLIFFLLSGFVISHATENRKTISWRDYIWLRLRRIYPVFIIALILGYLIKSIHTGESWIPDWHQLFGNLFMQQDLGNKPGVWIKPFAGNFPLWSLSYEMTFYILYIPLMVFFKPERQLKVATLVSWIAIAINQAAPNPWCNFTSLFIIWWAGVEMARDYRKSGSLEFTRQLKLVGALAPPCIFYIYLCLVQEKGFLTCGTASHPVYELRFYGEAILIIMILPIVQQLGIGGRLGNVRLLTWLGGISYGLYAFHYPIICGIPSVSGYPPIIDLPVKFSLVFLLAWAVERKFQPWINRVTCSSFRRTATAS